VKLASSGLLKAWSRADGGEFVELRLDQPSVGSRCDATVRVGDVGNQHCGVIEGQQRVGPDHHLLACRDVRKPLAHVVGLVVPAGIV
jgi:hypothetical protein